MTGKEFAEWLDKTGMDLASAASLFGTSEQTIYKWRSVRGVPESKSDWVRKLMAEHDSREIQFLPNRIVLEPTREQFIAWGRAALKAGELIDEWASKSLDATAEAEGVGDSLQTWFNDGLKVAEEPAPTDYPAKKEKGA